MTLQKLAGIMRAALAGVMLVASLSPVFAQQQSDNPFSTILQGPRFTTTERPAPDWIEKRRTGREGEFVPVGRRPEEPQRATLSPDQVRAREAELDGVAARHDSLSGRKRRVGQTGTSTAPAVKRERKPPTPCILTCDTGLGTTMRK